MSVRLWRRLLLMVGQNPKAGRCQGTCLLITASLSEHVFLCLSDICSRCFNNVIPEKGDNRTVGWCNVYLCQGGVRLPVIATQMGCGAEHGTHAETALKSCRRGCRLPRLMDSSMSAGC